ncbi:hypothetical protein ACROYT_G007410 [Oculina patagonica]
MWTQHSSVERRGIFDFELKNLSRVSVVDKEYHQSSSTNRHREFTPGVQNPYQDATRVDNVGGVTLEVEVLLGLASEFQLEGNRRSGERSHEMGTTCTNWGDGNNKVPTPKRPELFCFGWPNVTSVTVSIEEIPVDGIVQYDLFYNRTCPFVSLNGCSSAVTDLSLVEGCRRVENQTRTAVRTLATKDFSCTICNSTKNCYHMGITWDCDLCLYVRVNTSSGSSHVCTEQNVKMKIVFSPPKAIQLLAMAKKQLTVLWEHPEGIEPSELLINYKVILQDHFGQCSNFVKKIYGNGKVNSHSFTDLSPWSNYSVTICSGLNMAYIPVNDTTCTCGDDHHLPGGPVFNHTLPEEPSEQPLLEPCEAFCDDTNFNATLKWKASSNLIWNGIPTKSVIRIWNSSSPDQEGNELGAPTATFSVPLESNYNGSLVSLTVNLSRHLKYIAKVQFCSNGGCGTDVMTTLSCDVCESLAAPDPTSGNFSKNAESYWQLATGTGVALFILVIAVIITMVINKKKRQRNHAPLREVIGNLPSAIYEEPDSADMTSDDATYSQLYSSETQLLPKDEQTAQWV